MPIDRRTLLSSIYAVLATTPFTPAWAEDPWREAFRAAAGNAPWLLGFRSIDRDAFEAEVRIEGRWPEGLKGVFYRNGPAVHEVGDYRYRHWFDGDGLVQRFAARGDRLVHRARLVATHKRAREGDLGRAALPTFGSLPEDSDGIAEPDALNPGNISVLAHHGALLALWEAGAPWALDPDTLATRGLHTFSAESVGLPFSAHPRVDPDGTLWNFGYAGRLVLWQVDASGKVQRTTALDVGPLGMPHDFVCTERFLVFLLPPLMPDPDATPEQGFLGLHRWNGDAPTRVLVINKADLSLRRELELPAQWIFHFGNGFDDGRDVIRFDAARYPDPTILTHTFRSVMRGTWTPTPPARWTEYVIDVARGTVDEERRLGQHLATEFPRVSPLESNRRHERVVLLTGKAARATRPGVLDHVSCWHRRGDRLDSYGYPSTHLVEEHLLVPDPSGVPDSGGWVIGTSLDCAQGATELNVFDADRLSAGPVARARLPYALPLGFHGCFAEASA